MYKALGDRREDGEEGVSARNGRECRVGSGSDDLGMTARAAAASGGGCWRWWWVWEKG